MDKRIARKWIGALTSNEYTKCSNHLVDEGEECDSFCVLGVLQNLYVEETGDDSVWKGSRYELHHKVVAWAKLHSSDGEYKTPHGRWPRTLIDDNDIHKLSFARLARIIQDYVDDL